MEAVEKLLDIEREKINNDKRDNQTLRAQLTFQQNALY